MPHNPLRIDPSRTALIRRAYVADMQRRFDKVRKAVWKFIVTDDALGLGRPTTNAPNFKFETDDKKLKSFNKWLKDQIDLGILEINPVTGEPLGMKPWMYKYVDSAYKKGLLRAYMDTHAAELAQKQPFYEGSKSQFLQSAFGRPERVSKVRMMYTRSYEDLKGVTSAMSTKMSRILADSIAKGGNPIPTGRLMAKTIGGLTKQRAKAIALTETIHSHASGQLDGMRDLGVENVGAEVEISTAEDDAVCPICMGLIGKVFTIDEAEGVIPLHPRCRCCWQPILSKAARRAIASVGA
jgi:SPP1 gp7 family putative phage head morphogenesis protein